MIRNLQHLRSFAVARTFFTPTTLRKAFGTLGFVQADPIRAPARSQDLVMRHRVARYRVGDLDRWYASADIEEGVLYAYGFLGRSNWELLRTVNDACLGRLERNVLELLQHRGPLGSKDVETYFGRARALNGWGRQSRAANVAMEQLLHRGLIRVAARDQSMRRYVLAPSQASATFSPQERYRRLVLLVARVLVPLPEQTLSRIVARFRRIVQDVQNHRAIIDDLYDTGDLVKQSVAGLTYGRLRNRPRTRRRGASAFSPLSIRSSGTAKSSNTCGDGRTGSRLRDCETITDTSYSTRGWME